MTGLLRKKYPKINGLHFVSDNQKTCLPGRKHPKTRYFLRLLMVAGWIGFTMPVNGQILNTQQKEAQTQLFAHDSVAFFDYTLELMKSLPKKLKDERKNFETTFKNKWFQSVYSSSQRDTIYFFTERLKKKDYPVYPTLYRYLLMTHYLAARPVLFESWHQSAKELFLAGKLNELNLFIRNSYNFFDQSQLFSEPSINWRVKKDTFLLYPGEKPHFIIENCQLTGYSQTDTLKINKTSGAYYPIENLWKGTNGFVNWKRAGYDTSRIYTKLNRYTVHLNESYYEADSVVFYDQKLFNQPLTGKFKDGYMYKLDTNDIRYPVFVSNKFFKLKKLLNNIELEGYLSYRGDKLFVTGSDQTKARASIFDEHRRFLSAFGNIFYIQKNKFYSKNASISLYVAQNDSIFHPAIDFVYDERSEYLRLVHGKPPVKVMPYSNSYHKIDMYCRMMEWKKTDSLITFSDIQGLSPGGTAIFESYDYFSEERYYNIQLADKYNPLHQLQKFFIHNHTTVFHLLDFAKFTERSDYQTDLLMLRLAKEGFVLYDRKNSIVEIKQKTFNYIQAHYGKRDYDVMRFSSETQGEKNAEFNLKTFDLELRGIPVIQLSDSQQVFIYPRNKAIVMKKNRDFTFNGTIEAGNVTLYGDSCFFDYDNFSIDLPSIDSMRIFVETNAITASGQYFKQPVQTVIEDLSGDLKIDKPNNKSGLKKAPDYPILNSSQPSKTYYDKYSRFAGVYDRNRFKYHVAPFVIDSLDDFNPKTLKFEGFLESDIFPDIPEPLKIQPDYSLGFQTHTPKEGYRAYKNKGRYFDILNLSNQGFIGKGKLNYLSSQSKPYRMLFFPDSAQGLVSSFHIDAMTEPVEYPLVNVDTASIKWLPYQDSMIVSEPRKPFVMYDNQVALQGEIVLTPKALRGEGNATYDLAEIQSKNFSFRHHAFETESSDVNIKTSDESGNAVSITNFSSTIDIALQKGWFASNEENSLIAFPYNQYTSYLDNIDWQVNQKKLTLQVSNIHQLDYLDTLNIRELVDEKLSGARFVSTNPTQDSIAFIALKANYDLGLNLIEAEKVKYINVADAAIFPENEKLRIGKNASIERLTNAGILANMINKAHFIHSANVTITSRHYFEADGFYEYTDAFDNKQNIYFSDIHVDKNDITTGSTQLKETDLFSLSPFFDYFGNIHIEGSNPGLILNGYFRLTQNCENKPAPWIAVSGAVKPQKIILPIHHPVYDTSNQQVFTALAFGPQSRKLYPIFLNKSRMAGDYPLWKIDGLLSYDSDQHQYQIFKTSPPPDAPFVGPYMKYDISECRTEAFGFFDYNTLFGRMNLDHGGKVIYQYANKQLTMPKSVLGIDFLFAKNALSTMYDSLLMYDLPRMELKSDGFKNAMGQLLDTETRTDFLNEINLSGQPRKVPERLVKTLFFYDVSFTWDNNLGSFVASGPIGLGNLNKDILGRYIPGIIEIQPTKEGGHLNIYLKPTENSWYFFTFSGHTMEVLSSDAAFNTIINELKGKRRKIPSEKGKPRFEFDLAGYNLVTFFTGKMANAGIEIK